MSMQPYRALCLISSLFFIFHTTSGAQPRPNALFNSEHLYAIVRQDTGSGTTEVHVLNRADGYLSFLLHTDTALEETGTDGRWVFNLGDYNGDGTLDLYAIVKQSTGSKKTEVHILNGADRFQSFLLHSATALKQTGVDGRWMFSLGDYNGDGKLDLYAIVKENTGSGTTEVHVLNGADNFQSFLLNTATSLGQTGTDGRWVFNLGDYNGDGKLDLYAIVKDKTRSEKTEVQVLSGADHFRTLLLHTATALEPTGVDGRWMFNLGDYNGDGKLDLYAIVKENTGTGTTEVHILNGADRFRSFLLHTATALEETGADCRWVFGQSHCDNSAPRPELRIKTFVPIVHLSSP